jgi:HPt (histidine-containing phosphotransfer) domain-containing protein
MDGIEAAAHIRSLPGERYKTLPIIALSANAVQGARELFIEAGMNDFLAKPIDADYLNRALQQWLPPEKISAVVDEVPVIKDEVPPLIRELTTITGLDVNKGLSHIGGNQPIYFEVLRQLCAELDDDIKELCGFMEAENWKEYRIKIHALKGTLANIGMQEISDWAYKLEKAAATGEEDVCRKETDAICEALNGFKNKLCATTLNNDTVKETRLVDQAFLREKLAVLDVACQKGDSDVADALAVELETARYNEELDGVLAEIRADIASFNYDAVLEKSKYLIQKL